MSFYLMHKLWGGVGGGLRSPICLLGKRGEGEREGKMRPKEKEKSVTLPTAEMHSPLGCKIANVYECTAMLCNNFGQEVEENTISS